MARHSTLFWGQIDMPILRPADSPFNPLLPDWSDAQLNLERNWFLCSAMECDAAVSPVQVKILSHAMPHYLNFANLAIDLVLPDGAATLSSLGVIVDFTALSSAGGATQSSSVTLSPVVAETRNDLSVVRVTLANPLRVRMSELDELSITVSGAPSVIVAGGHFVDIDEATSAKFRRTPTGSLGSGDSESESDFGTLPLILAILGSVCVLALVGIAVFACILFRTQKQSNEA